MPPAAPGLRHTSRQVTSTERGMMLGISDIWHPVYSCIAPWPRGVRFKDFMVLLDSCSSFDRYCTASRCIVTSAGTMTALNFSCGHGGSCPSGIQANSSQPYVTTEQGTLHPPACGSDRLAAELM